MTADPDTRSSYSAPTPGAELRQHSIGEVLVDERLNAYRQLSTNSAARIVVRWEMTGCRTDRVCSQGDTEGAQKEIVGCTSQPIAAYAAQVAAHFAQVAAHFAQVA